MESPVGYVVTSYLRSFFVKIMPQKYLLDADGTRESGDRLIAWAEEQMAKRRAIPILVDLWRVSKCSQCGADIVWMTMKNGKKMPVTANTVARYDRIFDSKKNESHFPICREEASRRGRGLR